MQATAEQIKALEELQAIDRVRLQAQFELDELKKDGKADELRAKREEIEQKRDQVEALYQREADQLERYKQEDEHLAFQQKETQARIDEAGGDYRSLTSLTRDLEGAAKRRETIEFESKKVKQKADQIAELRDKADKAVADLQKQEDDLNAKAQEKAAELEKTVSEKQAERDAKKGAVPAKLLKLYETALKRCGGVAVAHLSDGRCDTCRSPLEQNRLLQVKKEAPLSTCPRCHRLLIVGE